jgi:hypothetical protein
LSLLTSSLPPAESISSQKEKFKEWAYGAALGYEDVFTKLENASRHYDSPGLGPDYVRRFVR